MQWTFIHLILKALKMNKITNRAVRSQILNSDFIIQRIRLEIHYLSFGLKIDWNLLCTSSVISKKKEKIILLPISIILPKFSFPSNFSLFLLMKMPSPTSSTPSINVKKILKPISKNKN